MVDRDLEPEQKALIVLEGLKGQPSGELCAQHEISRAEYYGWRDQFLAGSREPLAAGAGFPYQARGGAPVR